MNQNFCDPIQKVFIKILDTPEKVEREIIGAKIFSQFTKTPKTEALDNRTLKISMIEGTRSDCLKETFINNLIIDLFCKIKIGFKGQTIKKFDIEKSIESLEVKVRSRPEILLALECLKGKIKNQALYPVHGDLQRQNIFIKRGQLSLIDFEHFSFAPLELELANSLFFSDENCLDVQSLATILSEKKIISLDLLALMLVFYSIKEFAAGSSPRKCAACLSAGMTRLESLGSCFAYNNRLFL